MITVPSIFWVSIGAAVIALGGFFIVRKVVKPIDLNEHQGFLDAMLSIVGTLVSILLGLLVAAALDHYRALEQSVDIEAANVAQIYRLTAGLPKNEQAKLQKLCFDYSDQVVKDEWPLMEKGEASRKVLLTYYQLMCEVAAFRPSNDGESNLHSALINAAQQMGDCRRQRILVLHSVWSSQLMPMLILCAAIVLAFAYLYVRHGAVLHGIIICFVAIALGGNLGLVFLLSNPFSGDWKIQPRAFLLNAQMLRTLQSAPELKNAQNK